MIALECRNFAAGPLRHFFFVKIALCVFMVLFIFSVAFTFIMLPLQLEWEFLFVVLNASGYKPSDGEDLSEAPTQSKESLFFIFECPTQLTQQLITKTPTPQLATKNS